MHPVITYLVSRRHKKVPAYDHRKISLILIGEPEHNTHLTGSLLSLEKLGLNNAFEQIYALGDTLPLATHFLTHSLQESIPAYHHALVARDFFNIPRHHESIHHDQVTYLTTSLQPLHYKKITHSPTALYTRLHHTETNQSHFYKLNNYPPEHIEKILYQHSPLSFFNPGSLEIQGAHYKKSEGNYLSEVLREIIERDNSNICIISPHLPKDNLASSHPDRIFHITPSELHSSMYYKNTSELEQQIKEIETQIKDLFQASR